ncbi:MAG: chemotaxis protein CheB [Bacteroidales bacterium]|nr:chemotaxis protein CheB [Bacteroidales bacterium]
MAHRNKYEAVVIGSSAGGLHALKRLFLGLDSSFNLPVIIVQHLSADADNYLINILNDLGKLKVKEADEKEEPAKGYAYLAPPNYHLLFEPDRTFTLTIDERVNYARPSIDVLFETAAEAFKDRLIGIIFTGANSDGSKGLKKIKEFGGLTIVQDPDTAEVDSMPRAAIQTASVDHIATIEEIAVILNNLSE